MTTATLEKQQAETAASGIAQTGFYRACWYKRDLELPAAKPGQRQLLHFGAVDQIARVWVNDRLAGEQPL